MNKYFLNKKRISNTKVGNNMKRNVLSEHSNEMDLKSQIRRLYEGNK